MKKSDAAGSTRKQVYRWLAQTVRGDGSGIREAVAALYRDLPGMCASVQRTGFTPASLAELPPCNRESGTCKGRAVIGGGRKTLRDALYMPDAAAIRFNPDHNVKYAHLRADGKPQRSPSSPSCESSLKPQTPSSRLTDCGAQKPLRMTDTQDSS